MSIIKKTVRYDKITKPPVSQTEQVTSYDIQSAIQCQCHVFNEVTYFYCISCSSISPVTESVP